LRGSWLIILGGPFLVVASGAASLSLWLIGPVGRSMSWRDLYVEEVTERGMVLAIWSLTAILDDVSEVHVLTPAIRLVPRDICSARIEPEWRDSVGVQIEVLIILARPPIVVDEEQRLPVLRVDDMLGHCLAPDILSI